MMVMLAILACGVSTGQPLDVAVPVDVPPPLEAPSPQCQSDDECVIVSAIEGHDHIPDPAKEECGVVCWVSIPKSSQTDWLKAANELSGKLPCTKKFGRCPSATKYQPTCINSQCEKKLAD